MMKNKSIYISSKRGTLILAGFLMVHFLFGQSTSLLIPYQDNVTAKWGYVDENKNMKIPFQYESAEKFSDGLAKVYFSPGNGPGFNAFIDVKGDFALRFVSGKFIPVGDFHRGFLKVSCTQLGCPNNQFPNIYGGLNKKGELVLTTDYCFIGEFDSIGLAQIKIKCSSIGNNVGLIDTTGKIIVPPKYDEIGAFQDGITYFTETKEQYSSITNGFVKQTKYGLINRTGKELIPAKYDYVEGYLEGKRDVNGGLIVVDK